MVEGVGQFDEEFLEQRIRGRESEVLGHDADAHINFLVEVLAVVIDNEEAVVSEVRFLQLPVNHYCLFDAFISRFITFIVEVWCTICSCH